jgi:microcystin-dependent protein
MASPFVAEIRIFASNFPPTGWATCDGQLLPISQNTALFSLLGTFYGGDGKSTFALPNLQGSAPMHIGGSQPGPGLSFHDLGEMAGSETVTLLQSEMPAHSHGVVAAPNPALVATPSPAVGLARSKVVNAYLPPANSQGLVQMNPFTIGVNGSSLPHNNMMPFLTLTFCIALQGVFPPRQ